MALKVLKAILPERLPTQFLANYPNSFNLETWRSFQPSQDVEVTVSIYDMQGQLNLSARNGNGWRVCSGRRNCLPGWLRQIMEGL